MALAVCDVPGHVCFGHRCDRCDACERGECCGEAVVTADLPAQGSWPTPPAVPLGQMMVDLDGALVCHVCGQGFVGLYRHIAVHGLRADQYRAIFGLRSGQTLMAPVNSDARAERTGQAWREMPEAERKAKAARLARVRPDITPEQRSQIVYLRESRLQARGEGSFYDGEAQYARAVRFHELRAADPERDRTWRGRLIVARRRRLDDGVLCSVCGALFCVVNARAIKQRSPRKSCGSEECRREVKRRAQAASAAARRAGRAG
jgi:hypothetical protein